eukprot:13243004-Alexandrium_andersonii.AAC.1
MPDSACDCRPGAMGSLGRCKAPAPATRWSGEWRKAPAGWQLPTHSQKPPATTMRHEVNAPSHRRAVSGT